MAQQDDQNIPIEAEGEDAYMEGEGEMPEGVFIEGEDGQFFGEGEDFPFEQHSEEHMSHTTEEEKNISEVGDSEALVEDISIGAFREHNDHVYCVTQHPTKSNIFLSGGGDDRALVWDINDSEKDKNTLVEIKEGFKDSIEYIKFNHDSKYVLITGQGNPIRVYKVDESEGKPTFEFKQEMETGEDITFVTWHNKANLFLTGGVDMMVWMFNALNGEFTTYAGHEDVVNNAMFTPDGKLIVSVSNDCTARVWNPRTTKCLQVIQGDKFHQAPITSMFLINESMVSGDAEGYIYISQIKTGETVGPISKHTEGVESIQGNSAKSVACGSIDGTIKIIDVGKQTLAIDIPKLDDEGGVTRMQCSKLNPFIYVASTSGVLFKIDMRNGEVLSRYTAHKDTIMDFALDEENGKIATAGDDKVVYVFDI